MIKFKKRINQLRLDNVDGNFYSYRSHGKFCSCAMCSPAKAKINVLKKKEMFEFNYAFI